MALQGTVARMNALRPLVLLHLRLETHVFMSCLFNDISAYGWHCLGMDQASVRKIVLVLMELTRQREGQILSKQRNVVLCGGVCHGENPSREG